MSGTETASAGLLQARNELKASQRRLFVRRFLSNRLAVVGGILTVALAIVALLAPVLAPDDPYRMVVTDKLKPPGDGHLLGTDNFGRDLLSRILYGARTSMFVGFAVALATSALGLVVGLYASYYRFLDHVLMRLCDGLMAFPGILLAIAIMAALGPRAVNIVICLSIVFIPNVARVVRSAALVSREQTYIEAMKAMGAPSWRILWLHIAPNAMSPLIVAATFIFAETIIVEAALSFLGVGIPAPAPSWGNIVYDGKLVIFQAWWMTVFPGLAIILSVLGLNLFGDGLRDLLDPHTNQAKR